MSDRGCRVQEGGAFAPRPFIFAAAKSVMLIGGSHQPVIMIQAHAVINVH
jgi:hypothetical protein